MKVLGSVVTALALAATALPAAADAAADEAAGDEGLQMLLALTDRTEADDWMLAHDTAVAKLSGARWGKCADQGESVACIFPSGFSGEPGEDVTVLLTGIVIAADGSRCVTNWYGPEQGVGVAEVIRSFPGPKGAGTRKIQLEWEIPPGAELARASAIMTDAAQILALCPRIDRAMMASGKAF
ncbi:MAG: hypothetical protein Q4G26_15115 [Paracoccus sp. (in: a-proteobacteria)]|nr:hypothetical protein [Paracoccus sp. (in: a-proteobacteria)]